MARQLLLGRSKRRDGGVWDELTVSLSAVRAHAAIVGQSGCGKSNFLGRVLEELLLNTGARVVLLDLNADFCRITHPVGDDRDWKVAWTPESKEEFEQRWASLNTQGVFSIQSAPSLTSAALQSFLITWQWLSMELVTEGLDPSTKGQVFACHDLARALSELESLRTSGPVAVDWVLQRAEDALMPRQQKETSDQRATRLEERLNHDYPRPEMPEAVADAILAIKPGEDRDQLVAKVHAEVSAHVSAGIRAARWVSPAAVQFYFAKAHALQREGLLSPYEADRIRRAAQPRRMEVVHMPSLQHRTRQLIAASAVLDAAWKRALDDWEKAQKDDEEDPRRPTFVVIDEAHNLCPAGDLGDSSAAAHVREQIRRIAAEGRKYLLYLLVASQRPDKLDELIVSECGNCAVMQLQSQTAARKAEMVLGLPDSALDAARRLRVGEVLMFGKWSPSDEPDIGFRISSALRRTREGARKFDDSTWAV